MAGRATPFGLFSGCSLAVLGDETRIELGPQANYRRAAKIDFDCLTTVAKTFAASDSGRELLKFKINPSGVALGDRFHYVETNEDGHVRTHQLSGLRLDAVTRALLDDARRPRRLDQLVACVSQAADIADLEECREFVLEAIRNQIIVPDFDPSVTGTEPLEDLAKQIEEGVLAEAGGDGAGARAARDLAEALRQVKRLLADLGDREFGLTRDDYAVACEPLRSHGANTDPMRCVQVDLYKPVHQATVSHRLAREALEAAIALARICPNDSYPLDTFKAQFERRYGDRPVKLLEAVDDEFGIGFRKDDSASCEHLPLLDGLPFPEAEGPMRFRKQDGYLLGRLVDALRQGEREIVFDDVDLERLAVPSIRPLPDAFSIFGSIVVDRNTALERFHLQSVAGPSGASFLGRFCHADGELAAKVRDHLALEESLRPHGIFAEIVHLPEGREGNVIYRPRLRKHELEYLGRSGLPRDLVITADDVWIRLSRGRLILWSARLGAEIHPRLASAHLGRTPLPVYRLLHRMQTEGVTCNFGWGWGPLAWSPFLPRVLIGGVEVSRMTWNLSRSQLAGLALRQSIDPCEMIRPLREQLGLPRIVALVESDNLLPVDLDNRLSVSSLVQQIKNRQGASLSEYHQQSSELGVVGPEGRYVNEVVIPFVRRKGSYSHSAPVSTDAVGGFTYFPGSEWEFLKIYAADAVNESIVCSGLGPLLVKARREGLVERWFFIRYVDPDPHFRIRYHSGSVEARSLVRGMLHAYLEKEAGKHAVWKIQHDTYQPEVERYGGPRAIEHCESWFCHDSESALAIVNGVRSQERWLAAMLSVDALLKDAGCEYDTRKGLATALYDGLSANMRLTPAFKQKLGDRYREQSALIYAALTQSEPHHDLAGVRAALDGRAEPSRSALSTIKDLGRQGVLSCSLEAILSSFAHMTINRLLKGARRQEIVIYDFLRRHYTTQLVRNEQTPGAKEC